MTVRGLRVREQKNIKWMVKKKLVGVSNKNVTEESITNGENILLKLKNFLMDFQFGKVTNYTNTGAQKLLAGTGYFKDPREHDVLELRAGSKEQSPSLRGTATALMENLI